MSDEAFRLTPLDVRRWALSTSIRGYDKAQTDDLREKVADELERLARVNQELDTKARGFHEQLRAFREREKALNDALVSAQQLRAETRDQAEREAQLILREARAEGEQIVEAARAEARRVSADIEALERSRRTLIAQMRAFVERQAAELDAADAAGAPSHGSVHAAPSGDSDDARRHVQTPAWLDSVKTAKGE